MQYPISAVELAVQINTDTTRAGHLLVLAVALVDRYAPNAPTRIEDVKP